MDSVALVRRYYDALDQHEYETLEDVLSPQFVQRRPDRTFENREAFVRFMREERPNPDTSHDLERVVADGDHVAVSGRVLNDGAVLLEFADVFALENGRITRLETYSR
ncbi:nuclear transport factor 2 family protein [Natronorubrum daqingense]|uniref:DUF4440 domain-containing protein n=1 Tax=Natronorubrum daqingense TaxID=588898 RepID=A0A1N7CTR8_9EURY|nr:nuclear transport factor 2 family protein [Natronorubrum daqingense]APX97055.1 DUF4440 domain-containing protein [Natronorubrum daqingense]SIR66963.1 Ketosteroid isomerase-related protein [Natronorubrum daqingense]